VYNTEHTNILLPSRMGRVAQKNRAGAKLSPNAMSADQPNVPRSNALPRRIQVLVVGVVEPVKPEPFSGDSFPLACYVVEPVALPHVGTRGFQSVISLPVCASV
jgi:hypothetical protein